ncbi:MAG TPA: hypothetical protein DCZ75_04190 [Geobacter sp.]|nr:hypothetical protein [Geobacter sp.]
MATRSTGHSPANVTKHLKGIDFPAEKKDLIKQAQSLKAEKVVLDEIQRMEDREYDSMADVMKAFGKLEQGSSSSSPSSKKSESSSQVGQKSHSRSSSHH